jgi:predicted tellurium resistance membrane protein TerC
MWLQAAFGVLLCAVGTVFILQGTNVIHGSGMSGEGKWAVIGAVVVAIGLVCLAWAARQRRTGTTTSG